MLSTSMSGAVAVMTSVRDGNDVHLRLAGDVDMSAHAELAEANHRLSRMPARHVVVDVTDVGFAGAELLNFLAQLSCTLPDSAIVVRGASRLIRRLLEIADIDDVVNIEEQAVVPARTIPVRPAR